MNEAVCVRFEAIQTDQQVENGHRKGQTSLDIMPNAMYHLLEMANGGEHGKEGFDNYERNRLVELLSQLTLFFSPPEWIKSR